MLFNIILNKLNDNDIYEKSVPYSCFITKLSSTNVVTENIIKTKYSILKNQIFSSLTRENEKKIIFKLFNNIQKKYFILKRFFFKIYLKKCKYYEPQIDMSLNDLKNVKDHLKITLLQNNTKYVFLLTDLINIINTALTYNSGYFCTPQNIKNPYINLNFTKANLYNIYFKLKESTFLMPILFHRYFLTNFDLRLFGVFNENLIKEATIENILQTNDINKKFNFIKKMLGFYNKYRGRNKRITYDKLFPKKELVKIFEEYLKLFLSAFFIHDENVYSYCRIDLFKKLDDFKLNNPTFGRRIVTKCIKKLYYISVLNYEHHFKFDNIYYIPPPNLFNLEKKSIFITCYKKINYSIFSHTIEIKYDNGWDFIKNGRYIFLNERALKLIDAVIRPGLTLENDCSTHSSETTSINSEDEQPVRIRRNFRYQIIDNVTNDTNNFNYYLDTINTLFDNDSEGDSETSEELVNIIVDNDSILEETAILENIQPPSPTPAIIDNEIVVDNLYAQIDNNSEDSEQNTDSAPINSEQVTTSQFINELDRNFNTRPLNNDIYDLSTHEFDSSEESNSN